MKKRLYEISKTQDILEQIEANTRIELINTGDDFFLVYGKFVDVEKIKCKKYGWGVGIITFSVGNGPWVGIDKITYILKSQVVKRKKLLARIGLSDSCCIIRRGNWCDVIRRDELPGYILDDPTTITIEESHEDFIAALALVSKH